MKSYVKIFGPPLGKALIALEKVAVQMSMVTTMRFKHILIDPSISFERSDDAPMLPMQNIPISTLEKQKLISKASHAFGEFDFFFEWGIEPNYQQVCELINKIDDALAPLGCNYSLVTK